MSIRCKVCNTTKNISNDQMNQNNSWECQTCGNMLDINGNVISSF